MTARSTRISAEVAFTGSILRIDYQEESSAINLEEDHEWDGLNSLSSEWVYVVRKEKAKK